MHNAYNTSISNLCMMNSSAVIEANNVDILARNCAGKLK